MRYFLWRSIQDTSEQSSVTHRSSESVIFLLPLSCRPLANPFQPNPIANAGLTFRPEFPFLHDLHTRVPFRNTPPPTPPLHRIAILVIPTGAVAQFAAAELAVCVPGASPGRREHGNQSTDSRFNPLGSTVVCFSPSPTYPLFLSIPFIFPLVEIPFSI